ncbi:hypothetical protein DH2020_027287 [Rehmannia glutinosa]|uniref:Peptidylprolyl isomerase n=1 Tax=Rehmannia glutinosa TaxID=99300 RepID=A0ABR0VUJ7_REHGL
MASLRTIEKCTLKNPQSCLKPTTYTEQKFALLPLPISRRSAILISVLPLSLVALPQTLLARERRNRKIIPLEDYLTSCRNSCKLVNICLSKLCWCLIHDRLRLLSFLKALQADGLKYYDLVEGKGPVAEKGSTVQVHFDCIYRGITAVSSRESKLLAGNRIIAQPSTSSKLELYQEKKRKRDFVDNPSGLFSAQAAPKPPKAMYTITEGMKEVGGKRAVIIPPGGDKMRRVAHVICLIALVLDFGVAK